MKRFASIGLVGLVMLLLAGLPLLKRPSIVDIVGESEPEIVIDDTSALEAKLDQRTESLDNLYVDATGKLQELDQRLTAKCQALEERNENLTEIMLSMKGVTERVLTQLEAVQKEVLGLMKQSEAPPRSQAPSPIRPIEEKTLTFIHGDGCIPCREWEAGPDQPQIAAQCPIVPVRIEDLPPESRPLSVPAFVLKIGDLETKHRGYLTFARFKDMERAILEKRRSR